MKKNFHKKLHNLLVKVGDEDGIPNTLMHCLEHLEIICEGDKQQAVRLMLGILTEVAAAKGVQLMLSDVPPKHLMN